MQTNDFVIYLLSHITQQIIPFIITSITITIAATTYRYSLIDWNRNNLIDKIINLNKFTSSYALKLWAFVVIAFNIVVSICWPILITAATTSYQTIEVLNSTIDINYLLTKTSSNIENGDITTLLLLNNDEYLNRTCDLLVLNMGRNAYNCKTNNKYDLEYLGFNYHRYNSDIMGYNIMINVADPAVSMGSNYYSHSIGTLDFNGSNITKSKNGLIWRFDVGPRNMTIHPTDERLLGTSYIIPYNNNTINVMAPYHRLSNDINYRLMSSSFASNFSTTTIINDNENLGIFISTVQNQRTWFINGNYTSAIETFLNETPSIIPTQKINITNDKINEKCPISLYSYCGYAINIKHFEAETMTDIIGFFGFYLSQSIVSVSTTTYYTSLANYTKNMTINEPYYLQQSLYKYNNNNNTDRYRILYGVNSPYQIYELDETSFSIHDDIFYNQQEINKTKQKIINYMITQNGGNITYQYENIHAVIIFENWFKYLSITIIIIGILLFIYTKIFINKIYMKNIVEILNIQSNNNKLELFIKTTPKVAIMIGKNKINIDNNKDSLLDESKINNEESIVTKNINI